MSNNLCYLLKGNLMSESKVKDTTKSTTSASTSTSTSNATSPKSSNTLIQKKSKDQ